jgi:hypothetical protein
MGKQTMRQTTRLAASEAYAKRRQERAQRDRRLEKLAIEVLTALGERDATITVTEQRAGAAFAGDDQRRIIDGLRGGAMVRRCDQPPRSGPASSANRAGPDQKACGGRRNGPERSMTRLICAESSRGD